MRSLKISIRIILIFTVAILMSLIPDSFPEFFGDTICDGYALDKETGKLTRFWHYGSTHEEILTHWGYRHWLFFFMGLALFIIQCVEIGIFIKKESEK